MILLLLERHLIIRLKDSMKKGAILSSSVEILNNILNTNLKANILVNNYFRKNKFIGSKDKKSISNLVFNYLKSYFSLKLIFEKENINFSTRNSLLFFFLKKSRKEELNDIYDGKYSLKPEVDDKKIFEISNKINTKIIPIFPEWITKKNYFFSTKHSKNKFLASIMHEPKFDLRIDNTLYTRNYVIKKLREENISASKCITSPLGITLKKRLPEKILNNIKNNYFEIQDEGSQIVTLLIEAKEGNAILDYCAGRGTKTLALYNQIHKKEGIYVNETDKKRLNFLRRRLKKKKINNIKFFNHSKAYEEHFDIIVLDVPCSGSGIWRRRPENFIRLNKKNLDNYKNMQSNILNKAVKYCKKGGIIVYITCSILKDENEQQIEKFLRQNINFITIDLLGSLRKFVEVQKENKKLKWFTLMPDTIMSDGFFICKLKKNI